MRCTERYGPRIVSTIYSPKAQYRVVMEVEPKYQAYADSLSKIYVQDHHAARWCRWIRWPR